MNAGHTSGGPGSGLVEVRLHGRGGQGTVIASLMLARAAMLEGRHVQVFPEFGVERRGAPVTAFLRVAGRPIRLRCRVYSPDHILVMDAPLIPLVEVGDRAGWFVANLPGGPEDLEVPDPWQKATLDATAIARRHGLGTGAMPVVNSPMAAAFARVTGLVGLASLVQAIREMAPGRAEENVAAAEEAYEAVEASQPWHAEALMRAFGG